MAETLSLQQRELGDMQNQGDLEQRQLANDATNSRYGAASRVSALGQRRSGLLIEGVANIAQQGYNVVRSIPRRNSYGS